MRFWTTTSCKTRSPAIPISARLSTFWSTDTQTYTDSIYTVIGISIYPRVSYQYVCRQSSLNSILIVVTRVRLKFARASHSFRNPAVTFIHQTNNLDRQTRHASKRAKASTCSLLIMKFSEGSIEINCRVLFRCTPESFVRFLVAH